MIRFSAIIKLRFRVQAFNVFNHPSFDTPNNNVEFNPFFANPADYGAGSCFTQNTASGCRAPMCPPHGRVGRIQHAIGSPGSCRWTCT
jgi:hypothetical protein